ncbi:acid protease [Hymenopellis radicata]|nr:acid protease [Hymenopellis radicata]
MISFILFLSLLSSFELSSAHRFSLEGRKAVPSGIVKRTTDSQPLINKHDLYFFTNITLGGQAIMVAIDTASSDLWVNPPNGAPSSQDTGHTATIAYADGAVTGPVKWADLTFAGYQVKGQSFVEVSDENNGMGITGVLGLGSNDASEIQAALVAESGYGPLDRIFRENPDTPNYLTFLLGGIMDVSSVFPGEMTVGSILQGYEAIGHQPKLDMNQDSANFEFLLGENSIIGPSGQSVQPTVLTAALDLGAALNKVPKYMSDALYKDISGAEYKRVKGLGRVWVVPCEQEITVTFNLGGWPIAIHPLDVTLNTERNFGVDVTKDAGVDMCVGSFQPHNAANCADVILGMPFLRNTYTLLNYGDFVAGTENRGEPYIQFLATTDPSKAHDEFTSVRVDLDLNTNAALGNGSSDTTDKVGSAVIIAASAVAMVVALAVAGLAIYLWFVKRRNRRNGIAVVSANNRAYQPIEEDTAFVPPSNKEAGYSATGRYYDPYVAKLGS